jgi:hypothetical protein
MYSNFKNHLGDQDTMQTMMKPICIRNTYNDLIAEGESNNAELNF